MRSLCLLALGMTLGAAALLGLLAQPVGGEQKPMSLSQPDKEFLLKLARTGIRVHLQGETLPPLKNPAPHLCEPRGVFVSLHRQGQLRGCIGYLEAVKPLVQAVPEMAAAAAFHDPRFRPLGAEELADLEIEISVLTPMRRIDKVQEIQVGKHGLYIVRGSSRGLLLPQVATEYKWDRTAFLEHTCGKAGLPPDAWQDAATQIHVFTAEIFSDHSPKAGSLGQESKSP
jgi:AmmeMemoRadiSam system protein A